MGCTPTIPFQIGFVYQSRYKIVNIIQSKRDPTYLVQDAQNSEYKILRRIFINENIKDLFVNNLNNIIKISHPNIQKIQNYYLTQTQNKTYEVGIIICYLQTKSILDNLSKFTEDQIIALYSQIKSCLQFLHVNNMVHGNLKLEHISILKDKSILLTNLKIVNNQSILQQTFQLAPEEELEMNTIKQTDLWHLGIILLQLTTKTRISQLVSIAPRNNLMFPEQIFIKINIKKEIKQIIFSLLTRSYQERKYFQQQQKYVQENIVQKIQCQLNSELPDVKLQKIEQKIESSPKIQQKIQQSTKIQSKQNINFNLSQLGDQGLGSALLKYTNIKQLILSNCLLTDESGRIIQQNCKFLIKLNVSGNDITDKFIGYIQNILKKLLELNIAVTNVGDQGLSTIIKYMSNCKKLDLSYTKTTSKGLINISKLTKLLSLALWNGYTEEFKGIQKYQDHLILNNAYNYKKWSENKTEISSDCLREIQLLKLQQLTINLHVRDASNLIKKLNDNFTCIEITGMIDADSLKRIMSNKILQKLYLNQINPKLQLQQFVSDKLQSVSIVSSKINIVKLIKSMQKSKNLIQLNLYGCNIQDYGAIGIAWNIRNLTSLNLFGNNVSDQGVGEIAKNLRNLKILNLGGSHKRTKYITDVGAFQIAKYLLQLRVLRLQLQNIGKKGAAAIANNLINLKVLNLKQNHIQDEGVTSIALNLSNLTHLSLQSNQITKIGVIAIAKNLKKLLILDLFDNESGDQGAIQISRNLVDLRNLDLSKNKIRNDGGLEVAKNLKNIEILNLWYNQIGKDCEDKIRGYLNGKTVYI